MAGLVHDPEDIGAGIKGARNETRPEAVAAEHPGVKSRCLCIGLHYVGYRGVRKPLVTDPSPPLVIGRNTGPELREAAATHVKTAATGLSLVPFGMSTKSPAPSLVGL